MSGIEIAGVILGLWPIIAGLASAYKDGKTGESLKKVVTEIQVSEAIYAGNLRNLLLCDDQLSEEEKVKLLGPTDETATAWKQDDIQRRLRDCLGDKTCDSINATLTEIHSTMEFLENSLRKGEVDATSVRSRVKGALWQTRARRPNSEFQNALERLRKNVAAFRNLVSASDPTIRYQRIRVEKKRLRRVSDSGRKRIAAKHTNTFYEALEVGFQGCTCIGGHDTSLRVNYDDHFHVVFGVDGPEADPAGLQLQTRSTFDTAVSTLDGDAPTEDEESPIEEIQSPLQGASTEKDSRLTQVTTCWSSRSRNDSVSSSQNSQHAAEFRFFSTEKHTQTGRSLKSMLDLCVTLKTLSSTPPNSPNTREPLSSFGTLRRGDSIFTARGEPKILPPITIECLDDRLGDLCKSRPRKRVEIAQNLAFAVVQFCSTQWIDELWTWRNFSVRDDQLFITRRILPDQGEKISAKTVKFWRLIREPMLVRLGFALVELALGKRLSEYRRENGSNEGESDDTDDEKDYDTAHEVLKSNFLVEEFSLAYQAVVEACLTCEVARESGFVSLTRRAGSFQDDLDCHVVQPLSHYFENNWGAVQA